MIVKDFKEITANELWELSENEDVIISKENGKEQRVLLNYEQYKALKDMLINQQLNNYKLKDANEFDLNPHLEDLNRIVKYSKFKDITEQPKYFTNIARGVESGD